MLVIKACYHTCKNFQVYKISHIAENRLIEILHE